MILGLSYPIYEFDYNSVLLSRSLRRSEVFPSPSELDHLRLLSIGYEISPELNRG